MTAERRPSNDAEYPSSTGSWIENGQAVECHSVEPAVAGEQSISLLERVGSHE